MVRVGGDAYPFGFPMDRYLDQFEDPELGAGKAALEALPSLLWGLGELSWLAERAELRTLLEELREFLTLA